MLTIKTDLDRGWVLPTFVLEQYHETFSFIQRHIVKECSWSQLEVAIRKRQTAFMQGFGTYVAILPQLCNQVVGGDTHRSLPITAAWNLCDLSSDIFDDLQDRDGKDHIWNQWEPDVAISVGLGLLFAAQRCLADKSIPAEARGEIGHRWADTGIFAAQAQSIHQRNPLTTKTYFEQLIAKSGTIFSTAAWAGAYVGGATVAELRAIQDYGLALGILIQIRDDCVDLASTQILSDLRRGVFTLPVLYGLQQSQHPRHSQLVSLCHTGTKLSEPQALTIVGILDEMQALPFSLAVAGTYMSKAVSALSCFDVDQSRYLREYAQYVFASIAPQIDPKILTNGVMDKQGGDHIVQRIGDT
ncbi:MAG: polyprenyl synthetase family protein [Chloroflexi bacterium]|nr:polyprenyl synthetase family protein [Chloroflexota bacterium]